jgi:DNA primase
VAELPPDQDTDDVIQKSGAEGLKSILGRPKEVFAFLVDTLSARIDTSTPSGKSNLVGELLDRIATVPNPVKRAFLVKEVAAKFGMSEALLTSRLRHEDKAAVAPKAAPPKSGTEVVRELLSLIVAGPEIAARVRHEMPPERWPDPASAAVARKAFELMDQSRAVTASDLLAVVRDEAGLAALGQALERPSDPETAGKRFDDCLEFLNNNEFRAGKAGVLRENALLEARRQAPRNVRSLPRRPLKESGS